MACTLQDLWPRPPKFKPHSSGVRMSPPSLETSGAHHAGLSGQGTRPGGQGGRLRPLDREQQQEGPGVRTGLHPPAEHAAGGQRKGAPPLPMGGCAIPPLAGPWLPTQGTCPSQQRGDHTRRPSRALAALPPGNYTLGTGLLPLPGEAGGRARRGEIPRGRRQATGLLLPMMARVCAPKTSL